MTTYGYLPSWDRPECRLLPSVARDDTTHRHTWVMKSDELAAIRSRRLGPRYHHPPNTINLVPEEDELDPTHPVFEFSCTCGTVITDHDRFDSDAFAHDCTVCGRTWRDDYPLGKLLFNNYVTGLPEIVCTDACYERRRAEVRKEHDLRTIATIATAIPRARDGRARRRMIDGLEKFASDPAAPDEVRAAAASALGRI